MIPLYRPPVAAALLDSLKTAIASGWWGYGPASRELERRFVAAHGAAAIAVSSGSAALYLAARLLHPRAGDEVIVPATTFVGTAIAFHEAGFTVRIADVDPDTLMLSATAVGDLLSPRTKAVVAVHLYGQRYPVEGLDAVVNGRGIAIVEDRAHRVAFTETPSGRFACYSFNAMKEAPAADGGLLWIADCGLEPEARRVANLGVLPDAWERTCTHRHSEYGFVQASGLRLMMNDVTASTVLAAFPQMSYWRARRGEVLQSYRWACASHSAVTLRPESVDDSCLMAVCRVGTERRDVFRDLLRAAGIATSTMHYPSLSSHPLFRESAAACPNAEQAAREIVTLPLYPDISDEAVDAIAHVLSHSDAIFTS